MLKSSIKVTKNNEHPRERNEALPHTSVSTNSNLSAFGVFLVFEKLTLLYFS